MEDNCLDKKKKKIGGGSDSLDFWLLIIVSTKWDSVLHKNYILKLLIKVSIENY